MEFVEVSPRKEVIILDIEYIMKKKLCPFMSDSKSKVYCTEECALVVTHHDSDTNKLLGTTCQLTDIADTNDLLRELVNR